jgi:hypothetical protein
VTTVALAALLSAVVGLQILREGSAPLQSGEAGLLYVRSPEAMKRMALSYGPLLADLYWIRAIQHYGGDRLSGPQAQTTYQLLYPLLDLTTTLDPYFNIAYRFGAIFLSEAYPGGPGRPDESVALLKKAMVAMPQKWQYPHDIGFVYYWRFRDYNSAALWFQRAAEKPNAPLWLKPLAASMLARGEDRAAARFLWQQIAQSEEPWLRRTAERSILQLQAMDQIDQLNAVVKRFPPAAGELYSWPDLLRRHVLRLLPYDPTGTPYEIDPSSGQVRVAAQSPLFPMPQEPRRLQ